MIDFIYELPGGMEIYVRAEVTPETIVIHDCGSMSGSIDPDKIWVDTEEMLMPLTMLLKQEAGGRAHVS